MNDYTPTTQEVKSAYWVGVAVSSIDRLERYHEFERWLAQHDAEVAKAAEERIIKLLEDTPATRITWMGDGSSVYALGKEDYIALIKGEQK